MELCYPCHPCTRPPREQISTSRITSSLATWSLYHSFLSPLLCFPCFLLCVSPVCLCLFVHLFSLVCSDSNLLLVWHVVYSFSVCWLSISLMSTTRFYPKFDSEVHSGVVRCRLQYFDLISVHHSCAYRIGWGFVVGATWIILFHWLHRTCSCWFFFCLFYSDHFCHYSGAPSLISSI